MKQPSAEDSTSYSPCVAISLGFSHKQLRKIVHHMRQAADSSSPYTPVRGSRIGGFRLSTDKNLSNEHSASRAGREDGFSSRASSVTFQDSSLDATLLISDEVFLNYLCPLSDSLLSLVFSSSFLCFGVSLNQLPLTSSFLA